MKIIVTHRSPDLDAICSAWLIKRFLAGWEEAEIKFVPAGSKLEGLYKEYEGPIELLHDDQVIHVDTGLGPLDHHQTQNNDVCAASRTFEYVKSKHDNSIIEHETKTKALGQIVQFTIDEDHFQEVHYNHELARTYNFSLARLIDGFKIIHPKEDSLCINFGMECLDVTVHVLERRIWAEDELKEKGTEFETRFGKAIAVESINDAVLEIAQINGYEIAVRRDPKYGNIRIKARPEKRGSGKPKSKQVDLTPVYEAVKNLTQMHRGIYMYPARCYSTAVPKTQL